MSDFTEAQYEAAFRDYQLDHMDFLRENFLLMEALIIMNLTKVAVPIEKAELKLPTGGTALESAFLNLDAVEKKMVEDLSFVNTRAAEELDFSTYNVIGGTIMPEEVMKQSRQAIGPAIDKWAKQSGDRIVRTMKERTKKAVDNAIKNDIPLNKLTRDIQSIFRGDPSLRPRDKFPHARAIARTESTRSINYGKLQGMKASGIAEKQWQWSGLDRDWHGEFEAQGPVPVDHVYQGEFSAIEYPGDSNAAAGETVNCACNILEVVSPQRAPMDVTKFGPSIPRSTLSVSRKIRRKLDEAMGQRILTEDEKFKRKIRKKARKIAKETGLPVDEVRKKLFAEAGLVSRSKKRTTRMVASTHQDSNVSPPGGKIIADTSNFKNATTIKEAEKFADDLTEFGANYKDVDLQTANMVNAEANHFLGKYEFFPKVLNGIGHDKGTNAWMFVRGGKQLFVGIFSKVDNIPRVYARSKSRLAAGKPALNTIGHFSESSALKVSVDHEMGHVFHNGIRRAAGQAKVNPTTASASSHRALKILNEFDEIVAKVPKAKMGRQVSEYANWIAFNKRLQRGEAFAQCFAMYVNGKGNQLPPTIKEWFSKNLKRI